MSQTKSMAVKLDDETRERMKRLAIARNRTPHWMMREAISQYVDREEQREAFDQETIAAWNAFQADGLHLTFEEADEWLSQLAAGHDVEPPKCHK